MLRAWKRVGVVVAAVLGLNVAVPPGAVPEGDFPISWMWSWLGQSSALASVTGLPQQERGPGALDGRPASAADTRAGGGTGRKPVQAPGTLDPYVPHDPSAAKTVADGEGTFDARTSKRLANRSTASTDVFQNADGSRTTRRYGRPVNYEAADGTFQPIDLDLVKRADGRLHMAANSIGVSVTSRIGRPTASAVRAAAAPAAQAEDVRRTEELATVTLPTGESFGYWLEGAAPATGVVDGIRSTYPAVLPATDLELETFDAGVKETLVLHSPDAPSSWVFPLRLKGLTPHLGEHNDVELRNAAGETVAWFPAGYMYDSKVDPRSGAPADSGDITYALLERDGGWALRVDASQAWLRDPARVFPVRVDPTASTVATGDVMVDNQPAANGNGNDLPVGTWDGGTHKYRSFIHFDKFDDQGFKGMRITAAKLKLHMTWAYRCNSTQPFTVRRISEKWTVAGQTDGAWPGPALTSATVGSLNPTPTSATCGNTGGDPTIGQWVTVPLNVTTFNDWSKGAANNGLALVAGEGAGDEPAFKRFTSANVSGGSFSPVLELTYAENVKPQIDARYPAANAVMPTLTPELIVRAKDGDAWPNKGLKYQFTVYDIKSPKVAVADSGSISSAAWTVPAGKLAWNGTYLWSAQVDDTVTKSGITLPWSFTTSVPQPLITSGLAQNPGKGYDPSTGNYTTSATDASVPTVGPSLALTRSYNSLDTRRTNAFGTGWASVLDMRATQVKDAAGTVQTVAVTYPTGQDLAFGRRPDGSFTPPQGRFATFTETKSGTTLTGYTLTDKDASVYAFGRAAGAGVYRLTSITDANGRRLTVTHDAAGNPEKLTAASGRSLTLRWATPTGSTQPHVTQVITDRADPARPESAGTWTYTYGADDRLERVCQPDGADQCWKYGHADTSQYANTVLNAGPTSYWPLRETAGQTAASAVLSNAGTDNARYADVALGQPAGLAGSEATTAGFNGTSSHVQLPGKLIANGQYQTVSMWFRTSTPNGVLFSYNGTPVTKGSATSDYTPALYVDKNGNLRGQFWMGSAAKTMNSGIKVTDGKWHHVALAGAGDSQTLYVDGVARATLAGTIVTWSAASSNNVVVGAGFVGGSWPDHANSGKAPAPATYFNGAISDVAVFNQALTGGTVAQLRNAGVTKQPVLDRVVRPSGGVTAAVAYDRVTGNVAQVTDENGGTWKLAAPTVVGSSDVYAASVLGARPADYFRLAESDVGDPVNEVAGGDAGFNQVTLGVPGPFEDATAASFNGTSSYLEMPEADVPSTDPASISMWFKMANRSTAGGILYGYQTVEMSEVASNEGAWVPAIYVGTDGKLRGGLWTGKVQSIVSKNAVNDGKWHHVVLSAAPATQSLYLDGQLVGKLDGDLKPTAAVHAYVGAGKWSAGWTGSTTTPAAGYFPGSIAEVAYVPSTLSVDQVSAHWAAAKQTAPVAVTMVAGVAKAVPMPVSRVTVTGPSGEQLVSSYDLVNGNRLVAQGDALGNETRFGYDVGGFGSLIYDPNGVWTQNLQDVRGNTKQTITCQNQAANKCSSVYFTYYPDATSTTLAPDARNDLMLTSRDGRSASATDNTYLTSYAYDAQGNRTAVTDPLGRVTATTYTTATTAAVGGGVTPAGLPTTVVTPGGAKQTVRYYATGDVAEVTDPAGKVTTFTYDGLGRRATQTEVTDTHPQGLVTTYTYDAMGRAKTVRDPGVTNRVTGAVHTKLTTNEYDRDGNTTAVIEQDLTGGDATRTQRHTFNEYGQETSDTSPGGRTTVYRYDAYGRIAEEESDDGGVVRNAYDAAGRLLTSTLLGWTGDPNDPQPAKDLVVVSRSYDPAGRLASETDAMGWTTSHTYTDDGLQAKTTRTDGEKTVVLAENFYDAAGNVTKAITNQGATATEYTYDAANRQTSSRTDPTGVDRLTELTYDADDNVVSTVHREGDGKGGAYFDVSSVLSSFSATGALLTETTHTGSRYDPVARWSLAEKAGNSAPDSVGSLTGALDTGASWSAERDGGLLLNGSGSVETPGPALNTTSSYTVAAWVKLTTKSGNRTVLSQDGERASAFYLQYKATSDRWSMTVPSADADSWSGQNTFSTSVPQLDTWTHLAAAYDATDRSMKLYVNGKLEGSTILNKPLPSHNAFVIGRGKYAGGATDRWAGAVRDVRVYQHAVTNIERNILNGGLDSGQVVRTIHKRDRNGRIVSTVDPNGNTTYFANDEAGRPVRTTAPAALSETATGGSVMANAVSWTGYNTFGETTDTKDENGNWSVTTFDADGRATSSKLPRYTAPGTSEAVVPEVVNNYDPSGRLESVRDPLGKTTRYTYDQLDRLAKVTAANGGETRYRYNLVGDVLQMTDPNGAVNAATWDFLGRQVTTTTAVRQTGKQLTTDYRYGYGGWLAETVSPGKVTTKTTYDATGRPLTETDGAGNITRFEYGGGYTSTYLPDGTEITENRDSAGRVTRVLTQGAEGEWHTAHTSYDPAGNVVESTDPNVNTTTFEYDATNMLVKQIQPISDSDHIETTFGYDLAGNRTRFTDGRRNAFWTTYNSLGLPESQIEPATAAHPDLADRTFTTAYDRAGRPAKQVLPGGVTLTSEYDEMGKLRKQVGAGAEAATENREFDYDTGGRMTKFSGVGGTNVLSYDDRGLPTSITGPSGNTTFSYTDDGEVAEREDAAGRTSFTYDSAGRVKTLANTTAGIRESYDYNKLSQVEKVTFGTGNTRNIAFDDFNRPIVDELKTGAGASIAKIEYEYDDNDNLLRKKTTGFAGSADNSYEYDYADRLVAWNDGTKITAYAYDKSGNRVQNGEKLFTYDERNRLKTANGTSYAYTPRGTLASAGGQTTRSDAFGQVVNQASQTYRYDALGRSIRDGFSYSGLGNDLAADGSATYVRDSAGDVVATRSAGATRNVWTDQHDDVVGQFTADSPTLIGSATYDPLGAVLQSTGLVGGLGYQSEWKDTATNRVNMHARWYNVDTGQFDTRDMASVSPVPDSVSANRYQYGDANPLKNTDPTGHWSFKGAWNKAKSAVSSVVSTAWTATKNYVQSTAFYRGAVSVYNYAARAVKAVGRTISKAVHSVSKAWSSAKNWVQKTANSARKWVAQKAKSIAAAVERTRIFQAHKKAFAKVARGIGKTVSVIQDGVAATKKFVQNNKNMLLEIAAIGGAILAGVACTAVTAGVGAIACMAGTAALINLAKDGLQGDINSLGDALGSLGTGALSGLAGGAGGLIAAKVGTAVAARVGTGWAGRLATEAAQNGVEDVVGQAVTTGRVDVKSSVLGMVPGLSLLNRKGGGSGGSGLQSAVGVAGVSVGGGHGCLTAPAKGAKHSFDPDTEVLMADGSTRPIKDVNVGDKVEAKDPETGKSGDRQVTAIHRNLDRELTDLKVRNNKGKTYVLKTTQNHPFWNATDRKWTDAKNLRRGTKLGVEGSGVVVAAVRNYHGKREMRDLTVADIHTYYVTAGDTPVLVHNNNRSRNSADCGPTVYRQLNYDDRTAFDKGEDLQPRGTTGSITDHILNRPTKHISASVTEGATERFASGQGMVAIDVNKAIAGGAKFIDHNNVMQAANRSGDSRVVRDARRAEEVLFVGSIPHDAITLIRNR
ncbi:LamG-like jellyroll fold domain-containing protein [Spirilliplanes yamanashiensis]|uniref:Laminin G domain-containing protein n=1 Tax=Spirilliplanes yamanashiensis TaxID=42233 RepID=A0A8J3Y6J4_9ACTN|nr:LamG-like jellyroll fold domain-containing protein [Spirilliplanes yamanashiensis]MDP9814710.1 RHS repeat-associated protein [Spirilliplanes yamanashiensis]GIJ02362.1 hypothetical protein Sya03_17140 [Spirilliplanes yamanashiensis]